jgi:probable HAF family extracellular repeat protein
MQTTNAIGWRIYRKLVTIFEVLTLLCSGRAVAQIENRHSTHQTRYRVVDLGTLGGTFSAGWGINDRRWISGVSSLPGDVQSRAFLWRRGVMTDLGTLGGPNSWSYFPLNERGTVTGGAETSTQDPMGEDFCSFGTYLTCLPVVWGHGSIAPLPLLGGDTKAALTGAVWPDTGVMDNTLAQCLVEVRRALGDNSQQMIRTVTRRGYLFAAPVTTAPVDLPLPPAEGEAQPTAGPVSPAAQAILSSTGPAFRKPRSMIGVVASLALAGAAAQLGSFAWLKWRAPENPEPVHALPLNTLPGAQRYPSFSPDGNHVAFTWTGPKHDNQDVYIQQIGSGYPLRLTLDSRIDYNPVWSPDGRWIAFLRRKWEAGTSELLLIPPLGGPERKLAEIRVRTTDGDPRSVQWLTSRPSPREKRLILAWQMT